MTTTQAVTNIGTTTATGNGNITVLGVPSPGQHGVCWNTSATPTIAGSNTTEGSASVTGAFTSNMTALSPDTVYYVRAYAINTEGTAHMAMEVSFTTDIDNEPIPTLNEWGMIIFSLLMAGSAFWFIKKKSHESC